MGNEIQKARFDPEDIPYEQREKVLNMDLSLRVCELGSILLGSSIGTK